MQYHYSEHSRKITEARLESHQQTHAARAEEVDGVSYDGLVLLGAHAVAAATSLDQMKEHAEELTRILAALIEQLDADLEFLYADDEVDTDGE
jgi:hypothetical protein